MAVQSLFIEKRNTTPRESTQLISALREHVEMLAARVTALENQIARERLSATRQEGAA